MPEPLDALNASISFTCAHGPNLLVHFGPIVAHSPITPCFGGAQVIPTLSSSVCSASQVGPSHFGVSTVSFLVLSTNDSGLSYLAVFTLQVQIEGSTVKSIVAVCGALLPWALSCRLTFFAPKV